MKNQWYMWVILELKGDKWEIQMKKETVLNDDQNWSKKEDNISKSLLKLLNSGCNDSLMPLGMRKRRLETPEEKAS